jgi:hypothetical protein
MGEAKRATRRQRVKQMAVKRIFAVVLLLLAGCEDYAAEVAAVRAARVRSVAGIGETRDRYLDQTLAHYVALEFAATDPDVRWSGRRIAGNDDTADLFEVTQPSGHRTSR